MRGVSADVALNACGFGESALSLAMSWLDLDGDDQKEITYCKRMTESVMDWQVLAFQKWRQ